jgi:nitrogen fixation/metabolism regulation signal transduction histidine kinase
MNGKRRLLGSFNHGSMACAMPQAIGAQLEYLILNSVQAMSAVSDRGRLLTIKTERGESNKILVAVQDCGIGIDPGDIERVFAAFHTTKPNGMGMGLSISRSIVENHGGRLWATPNDGPGVTSNSLFEVSAKSPSHQTLQYRPCRGAQRTGRVVGVKMRRR